MILSYFFIMRQSLAEYIYNRRIQYLFDFPAILSSDVAKTHGFADGKLQRCLKTEVVLPVEWAADLWQETGVTIYRVDLDCLRLTSDVANAPKL